MEKETLLRFVESEFSISRISLETGLSKTTIRYWLKKHSLKTRFVLKDKNGKKLCPRCNTEKNLEFFYNRRNKIGTSAYCKECTSNQVTERQLKFKQDCVDYKGGCCSVPSCGYRTCLGALEFHHLNPAEKDFSICQKKLYRFDEIIRKELDKCILVCSNHHREIHAGLIVI